jgi:serine/threonine protein kinase
VSPRAKDIISKLLTKDPAKRLGARDRDALEVREHEFVAGIDWIALMRKEIEPEWKPSIPDGP